MSEPENTTTQPPLPVVHDEAGDTPVWLPLSGLACFVVLALFVLWRASHPSDDVLADDVPADGATGGVVVEVLAE